MGNQKYSPVIKAILASILFGAGIPFSKLLQAQIAPLAMSSFLFIGSGFGSLLFWIVQNGTQRYKTGLMLSARDMRWLAGAVLTGGVAAPALLMYSLRVTPAATASLLMNFDVAATMLIAVSIFKEALSKRTLVAVAIITVASILLSWNTNGGWGFSIGSLGVLGACVLWGADNNFTRKVSAKDPLMIVSIKGLGAGAISFFTALSAGSSFPAIKPMVGAMLLGFLSYGTSTVFFILALRGLGAAKAGAFSGMTPFIGMVVSFLMFREPPGILFFIALPVMILGIWLIVGEELRCEHTVKEVPVMKVRQSRKE